MAYVIIDRRKNDKKKSAGNRARYVRRVREQVKEAVKDLIRDGSIQDSLNGGAKKVSIKKKGLNQPEFHHDSKGGVRDVVRPGNKEYEAGDRIPKPPGGQGQKGNKGSPDGEGEDDFQFSLSREEFLDLFFEDLELPDMVKKDMISTETYTMKRAGFSVDGNPSRLNILRSMKFAKSRRIALKAPKKKEIRALEEEIKLLEEKINNHTIVPGEEEHVKAIARLKELKEALAILYRKKKAIPFVDDMDLRYNRWEKFPNPTTQAVMFGLMDVSASMDEWKKEMAKRFFILMLLFLQHNYERVDIVWIRHHTTAKEVDEQEFFHSQESGGTVVSTAYELMMNIIKERYSLSQWNVFGTHISDGDNYSPDNVNAKDILSAQVLPASQYFAYVEVKKGADPAGTNSDLWPIYKPLTDVNKNFVMSVIGDVNQIYPMFRKLFEKRGK